MDVSIVIPNWNGVKKLKQNLPSVVKTRGVLEIVVVDDGSTDGSVEFIKKEYPNIKLIEKKENSGFSSTVNLGVKNSEGAFIFLLNSDAAPSVNCVEMAMDHFRENDIFSVGCNAGGSWSWALFKHGFFWHRQSKEKVAVVHQTLWASGGSGIFRKSIWEELGGFDELFDPFYEEDVDLGYRATKRGYRNLYEPKSMVEHYKQKGVIEENFSKEKVASVAQRNQLFFIWKNITDKNLILRHVFSLLYKLVVTPGYWKVFLPAVVKLPQVLKKRRIEKRSSKLTDREVLDRFDPVEYLQLS